MRSLIVVVLVACAAGPKPAEPRASGPRAPERPATVTPPELDDAAIKAKSKAFFDSIDQHDLAGFQAMFGPAFALFEDGRSLDGVWLGKTIQSRIDRHAPRRSRECKDETIHRSPGVAVYIADCVEHIPADGEAPAAEWQGYNTLVWTHDGASWKVSHWQWQKSGIEAERDMWNDTFRKSVGFKLTPNQLLIDTIKGARPGTALDVLMGQGRNALYLAAQGWKVTGVDISDEGIRIARETAAKQKLKLETVEADIEAYDFGVERWDLVTMIYAGSDPKTIEKVKPSIKRGGSFVAEYFLKEATAGTGIIGFEAGQLAKLFAGWTIVKDEVVDDIADWGLRKTKLVRFVARKP